MVENALCNGIRCFSHWTDRPTASEPNAVAVLGHWRVAL